jgi:hypothetical protein
MKRQIESGSDLFQCTIPAFVFGGLGKLKIEFEMVILLTFEAGSSKYEAGVLTANP